jgi:hypothetical protein
MRTKKIFLERGNIISIPIMNNSITHVVPERRFLKFQQIRKFIGEAATPNFQTK